MKKILLLAVSAIFATACADNVCDIPENEPEPITTFNDEIAINPVIASVKSDTRTTITGSTATWKDDDTIGLFCSQATGTIVLNNPFSVQTNVWSSASKMYWKDGTTSHKFVAYTPYVSGYNTYTAVPLPNLSTQTGTINPAHDFLYSNNQWSGVTRASSPLQLTFVHALSLIEFDFVIDASIASGTTLSNIVLASATTGDKLYSGDATSSKIDISTGTITAGTATNTATITPASAPVLSTTSTPFYVLILPGTFTTPPSLTITISESGTSITLSSVSLVTTSFLPKTKYTYTVTISRSLITISTPTITDWSTVNGGSLNPGV